MSLDTETHSKRCERALRLCISLCRMLIYNGDDTSFHVRRSHQRYQGLVRGYSYGAIHDWFLELDHCVAEGERTSSQ